MRPKKTRKPFTLFQRETQAGPVWYVQFWDENAKRYTVTRSTGVPVKGSDNTGMRRKKRHGPSSIGEIHPVTVNFTASGEW